MRIIFLFISIVFLSSAAAQENLSIELINEQIEKLINQYREEHHLPSLYRSNELDETAADQAKYLQGKTRIEHTQDNRRKQTVVDRSIYYGGLYSEVKENISIFGIRSRQKIYPSEDRVEIRNEVQVAAAAMHQWLHQEEYKKNILGKHYFYFGSEVIQSGNNLNIVVVFAGEPYELPGNSKGRIPKQNINNPNKDNCAEVWEKFNSIPQLFSDAFVVEGNEVYFRFHSLPIAESIFSNGADGIAVDVIYDEQFSCNEGNRLYPGEINDGFLMPTVKRNKILTSNEAEEEGRVNTKLGSLPSFYNPENCEINAVIIKNGTKCFTVPYNKYEVLDLKALDIPYQLIGKRIEESSKWKDTLKLSFSMKNDMDEILNEFRRVTNALNYQLDEIRIKRKASPIVDLSMDKKAEAIMQILESEYPELWYVGVIDEVAWEEYFEFQKNSVYEIETKDKDTLDIKNYLKETVEEDSLLADFLNDLNVLEFEVFGTAEIKSGYTVEEKKDMFNHLLSVDKVEQALSIQRSLIEDDGAYQTVLDGTIAQQNENLQLINNQIIAAALHGEKQFQGNPIYLAFLELYLISKEYPILNFNRHLSLIKYWAESGNTSGIENWQKSFNLLKDKEEISSELFAKTTVNYALLAANYYYDKQDYLNRKKSFDLLIRTFNNTNFTDDEVLDIAKYFAFQDQFDRAITLLLPKVNADEVGENILYYFLQIAIYQKELVPKSKYFQLLEKAKALYPNTFCSFFGKEKRGIQALKDYEIKNLYCSTCE